MTHLFHSKTHEDNFNRVLQELEGIGFSGLVERQYDFPDFFSRRAPNRKAPAVAFGGTPFTYDSACVAVLVGNGTGGTKLISKFRALGAPRAFEVHEDVIAYWRVSTKPSPKDRLVEFRPEDLPAAFREHAEEWNRENILRLKNLVAPGPQQMDLIDLGLIPALEESIKEKLGPLLQRILYEAKTEYEKKYGVPPSDDQLVRLAFRALSGKIMVDRGILSFGQLQKAPAADDLLTRVAEHYKDFQPVFEDREIRQMVVDQLWGGVNLKHISVEVLAYIWENTLVTDDLRKAHSIHATPSSIARYVVRRLPMQDIPQSERRVVEPCCGSGTFLVASLQRLRELLPIGMGQQERHSYFKEMLSGFDIEEFGLEVARCCLMLADFPNGNNWNLWRENVFESPEKAPRFHAALGAARIVLCNPPFGPFPDEDRAAYAHDSKFKEAEILARVLRHLPPQGILGFVMRRQVLDGVYYQTIRERLAKRFDEIEVLSLPDKVFEKAELETALLLAKHPRADNNKKVAILHRKVEDQKDWRLFKTKRVVTREDSALRVVSEASQSLSVPDLDNLWKFLSEYDTIGDVSEKIHRGIEWNVSLRENRDLLISSEQKPGFRPGLPSAPKGTFFSYQCPLTAYLNVEKKYQRNEMPFNLPWELPKVVMNGKRRGRGPWRITAFHSDQELVCYQTYIIIWPSNNWKNTVAAAILNGYVANAYVASHEGSRDITNDTVSAIPVPELSDIDVQSIDTLVHRYVTLASDFELSSGRLDEVEQVLNEIDALVLSAYRLPAQLNKELLDYFKTHRAKRRVPFKFKGPSNQLWKVKNRKAIAVLKEWAADESGYDEEIWPEVKKAIEENSLSTRKRFHD